MRRGFHRWFFRTALVTLLTVPLGGCGLFAKLFHRDKKDQEPEKVEKAAQEAPVRVVGEIASVHREEGFVLIRRHSQGRFGAGNLISSVGPAGNTSSLRLTGETLGRYFAADIQEGNPAKGDLVVARSLPEGPVLQSTPVPEAPKPGFGVP